MARQTEQQIATEASRILNFLAAMPAYGHEAATTAVVRKIMLDTGGQITTQGYLWDIKAKRLGGGVSRISLEKVPETLGTPASGAFVGEGR